MVCRAAMGKDVLSLIDAAYTFDIDEEAWLRGLADAARVLFDVGLGLFTVFYDASDPDQLRILTAIADGLPDGLDSVLVRHAGLFDREWVQETVLGFTCDHIRHPRFSRHPAGSPELLDSLYAG